MSYEEKGRTVKTHRLTLDAREKLTVSGVEELESFDESEVILQTMQGRLVISGEGLHVDRLDVNGGELNVDGTVTSLVYEESAPGGSLWSRLFK